MSDPAFSVLCAVFSWIPVSCIQLLLQSLCKAKLTICWQQLSCEMRRQYRGINLLT